MTTTGLFSVFHGTIFVSSTGPFWKHFGVILSLKIVLEALCGLFALELDFPGSTPPILAGFGELLGRLLDIFWYLMSM